MTTLQLVTDSAGPAARRATSDGGDPAEVEATWVDLESQARAWLDGEQVPGERQRRCAADDAGTDHCHLDVDRGTR